MYTSQSYTILIVLIYKICLMASMNHDYGFDVNEFKGNWCRQRKAKLDWEAIIEPCKSDLEYNFKPRSSTLGWVTQFWLSFSVFTAQSSLLWSKTLKVEKYLHNNRSNTHGNAVGAIFLYHIQIKRTIVPILGLSTIFHILTFSSVFFFN